MSAQGQGGQTNRKWLRNCVNLWERSANWFWFGKKKLKKGQRFSANLILVPHSCEEDIKKGWLQKVDYPIVFAKAFE